MSHVLVVRPDNNGDVLLAGPAVRAIGTGGHEVTLWTGPRGRAAAELLPGVARIVTRELPWIDPDPAELDRSWLERTIDEARDLHLDAAFVLSSFHQSPLPTALVLRAAGVPWIAATSVDYPGSLLDLRHRIGDHVHEVERSLDLVAAAGHRLAPGDDGLRIVDVGPRALPWGDEPYVVVHPGASVPARTWAPAHNRDAVAALRAAGWRVVVTGAPSERALTAAVAGPPDPGVIDAGGACDWRGLAAVIRDAAAIVVGNTGPAHLAAAVGTPVVSVYAPTVPASRWRPWKIPHELLGDQEIACAGCRARTCPFPGHPCLGGIRPVDVLAAVGRLAERPVGPSRAVVDLTGGR